MMMMLGLALAWAASVCGVGRQGNSVRVKRILVSVFMIQGCSTVPGFISGSRVSDTTYYNRVDMGRQYLSRTEITRH